jgi:DNA invertase Pin-like site-specific DNA recombinase
MSNFRYLFAQFPAISQEATEAEQLAKTFPKASAVLCRSALEKAVIWMYENEQSLEFPYNDALKAAGCEQLYTDTISGATKQRPQLDELRSYIRKGDTLVVWRLDRLGRSLKDLIEWVEWMDENEIAFKSITESIDTSTSGGELIFSIFGAIAEFERNLIRERTKAGLAAARARGRLGGRPKKLDAKKIDLAKKLYASKEHTIVEICEAVGVSKATLYKYL